MTGNRQMARFPQAAFKKVVFYGAVFGLVAFSLLRLVHAYLNNPLIDFLCYVDCTRAILNDLNCYDPANLTMHQWDDPLIVFPGMTLFFVPFAMLSYPVAKALYFPLTVAAALFSFVQGFRITGLLREVDFREPDQRTWLFFLSGFLFFNSAPVLMCLRHGQSPVWVTLGIVLFFSFPGKFPKTLVFALSTLMKYSKLPLFALTLLAKKQIIICFGAFVVFALLAIYPLYIGNDLVSLYSSYFDVARADVADGFNSFAVSGYNMVQIEFFRRSALNVAGKLIFGALAFYVIWREAGKAGFGLNLLLFLTCVGILFFYNRLYNLLPVMLLLLLKTNLLIRRRDWLNTTICALFLTLMLVPVSWVFALANHLGGNELMQQWFITSSYQQFKHILPVYPWVMILLAVYTFLLYRNTKEEVVFDLPEKTFGVGDKIRARINPKNTRRGGA